MKELKERHMEEAIPPCNIRIDKEGNWYYQGVPIIHREVYRYLNQCLRKDPQGRYILVMDGERCYLEVEDTPYVVNELRETLSSEGVPRLLVRLNDGSIEELRVETLRIGEGNVMYCRVKGGEYEARFLRASYYQLSEYITQEGEKYYLTVGGKKFEFPLL